ncbi:hypothetical protein LTS18_000981, partial [Coniosporium uncinatum]
MKDNEGLGPLDLFTTTIKDFSAKDTKQGRAEQLQHASSQHNLFGNEEDSDSDMEDRDLAPNDPTAPAPLECELYTFGSNKNITLGFQDQDNRQFPARVTIKRPENVILALNGLSAGNDTMMEDLPTASREWPWMVADVQMSKYHTAVLTCDAVSNLYIC